MFLLLGRASQEAKKNDLLAEKEVTGKEFREGCQEPRAAGTG